MKAKGKEKRSEVRITTNINVNGEGRIEGYVALSSLRWFVGSLVRWFILMVLMC